MEEVGVPGIIIGIEDKTCYELGLEDEAYRGGFKSQTRLKLNLLTKIIEHIVRERVEGGGEIEV